MSRQDEHEERDIDAKGGSGSTRRGNARGRVVKGGQFPHLDLPDRSAERNADVVPRVPEGPKRGPNAPATPSTKPRQPEDDERKTPE